MVNSNSSTAKPRRAKSPRARSRAASSDGSAPTPSATRKRANAQPPRSRLDVDERRAQLLGLGLAMFSERSYDEVSIDAIASAAGVSKGLLYHYFPTKRDLYVAALDEAARGLVEQTTAAGTVPPGGGATDQQHLVRGLSTYLDFVEQHGQAYVALMRGGIGSDPEVAAILERTRGTFGTRILEHMPAEHVKKPLVAMALRGWIGFVEAASIDWVARHRVHRDDLVELLAGMIVDALGKATFIAARARPAPRSRVTSPGSKARPPKPAERA